MSVARTSSAREAWKRIETIHAVVYFTDDVIAAAKAIGLRGFWMGYFGVRAAPLGAVAAGPVEASFANFAPAMVRRSLPDAWSYADPADVIEMRAHAAAAALRRLDPGIDAAARRVNEPLARVVAACPSIGRPLFAANRDVASFDDPVAQLWQHCTSLREHRGDGHVLALAASGVDGCEAHLLLIADQGLPVEVIRDNRGWTDEQWNAAGERLANRGLLDHDELSEAGARLRSDVEDLTDALAHTPFMRALGAAGTDELIEALSPSARAIARSGEIPYPNPMGLPRLGRTSGSSATAIP